MTGSRSLGRLARPARALAAQSRNLKITHRFDIDGTSHPQDYHLVLQVVSERFVPAEVTQRGPLPDSQGFYDLVVPSVVLAHASWPFERSADQRPNPQLPWLALLVFDAAEGVEVRTGVVRDLVKTEKELLGYAGLPWPPIAASADAAVRVTQEEEARACRYIDLTWRQFRACAPPRDALAKLVHLQQAPGDAAPQAVVLSHRVVRSCRKTATGDAMLRACLVSLEGLADFLPTARDAEFDRRHDKARIRLLVLDSWEFASSQASGETPPDAFNAMVTALKVIDPQKDVKDFADVLRREGFVTFDHRADPAMVYRGPLRFAGDDDPAPVRAKAMTGAVVLREVTASRSALMVDDISYAAACELGRLLGLGDPVVGRAMLDWRTACAALPRGRQKSAMLPEPPDGLTQRLDAAVRLDGLPAHYLLPAGDLLSPETLRVFHLDVAWCRALLHGVCGVGRDSHANPALDAAMSGRLTTASGLDGLERAGAVGVLVRSAAVALWPGLEIVGKRTVGGDDLKARSTRLRLSPDILIVLFDGPINLFEVRLPVDVHGFFTSKDVHALIRAAADSVAFAEAVEGRSPSVTFEIQSTGG